MKANLLSRSVPIPTDIPYDEARLWLNLEQRLRNHGVVTTQLVGSDLTFMTGSMWDQGNWTLLSGVARGVVSMQHIDHRRRWTFRLDIRPLLIPATIVAILLGLLPRSNETWRGTMLTIAAWWIVFAGLNYVILVVRFRALLRQVMVSSEP